MGLPRGQPAQHGVSLSEPGHRGGAAHPPSSHPSGAARSPASSGPQDPCSYGRGGGAFSSSFGRGVPDGGEPVGAGEQRAVAGAVCRGSAGRRAAAAPVGYASSLSVTPAASNSSSGPGLLATRPTRWRRCPWRRRRRRRRLGTSASVPPGSLRIRLTRCSLAASRLPVRTERHAPPAVVVDPEPGRDVGVGVRVVRRRPDVVVARRTGRARPRPGRADGTQPMTFSRRTAGRRPTATRRLHGHLGGDLEQVGDEHVEHRAGGVVERRRGR